MSDTKTLSAISLALLPSTDAIMAQANMAFADTITADNKQSTAEQRMAYVVQCTITNEHADGKKELKLDFAFSNKEHKSTILTRMVSKFAGAVPSHKGVPMPEYMKAANQYRVRANLVKRGAWIAIVLASRGVVYTAFNVKTGVYTVPTASLLPAECTPLGRMAKDERIPLDRSPIAYMSKAQVLSTTQASVKHMLDCVVPKSEAAKGRDKSKTEDGKDTKTEKQVVFGKATATELANSVALSVLIASVHQLFVKDSGPNLMRQADMPQSWNLLSDIMRKYDECKAGADWLTPRDAKDADERIAPPAKSKKAKAA